MSTTKKYVSLEKLSLYDEKIKKFLEDADTATLNSAKAHAESYANSLASNYDAAGAAATAEQNAKAYTDELAGGAVAGNTAAIEKLNGTGEGSVAKAVADSAATLQASIDAVDTKATNNATAIGTLEGKVKSLEEGTYDDTAIRELITANANAIDALGKTHVEDKTELSGLITAEKDRAEGIEGGLRTDVDAIKGDYLKKADKEALQGSIDGVAGDVATLKGDATTAGSVAKAVADAKTELEGKIALKADQTALDAEIERATGVEASLQTQINTIMNNPDAEGAINSINEFTTWVAEHGTIADGMRTDINKNKEDIAAEVKRAGEAEAALSGRIDTLAAIDHDAYKAADTALKTELTTEIGKKADADVVTGIDGRVGALETASATHATKDEVKTVSDALTEYKNAHTGDYTNAQVDAAIKVVSDAVAALDDTYATDEALAQAVADVKADSANKDAVVLAEAQKAVNLVQTAVDTHTAKTDIHVTTDDKTKWNAALQASDVATGSANGTISVKGTDVAVKGLGSAAFAATTAFDASGSAAQALTDAKAYTDAAMEKFVEVSEQDILDMFK